MQSFATTKFCSLSVFKAKCSFDLQTQFSTAIQVATPCNSDLSVLDDNNVYIFLASCLSFWKTIKNSNYTNLSILQPDSLISFTCMFTEC